MMIPDKVCGRVDDEQLPATKLLVMFLRYD